MSWHTITKIACSTEFQKRENHWTKVDLTKEKYNARVWFRLSGAGNRLNRNRGMQALLQKVWLGLVTWSHLRPILTFDSQLSKKSTYGLDLRQFRRSSCWFECWEAFSWVEPDDVSLSKLETTFDVWRATASLAPENPKFGSFDKFPAKPVLHCGTAVVQQPFHLVNNRSHFDSCTEFNCFHWKSLLSNLRMCSRCQGGN